MNVQRLSRTEILVRGDERLLKWRDEHKHRVPGYKYMSRYKYGDWDGYHLPGKWCRMAEDGALEMRCSRGLLGRLAPLGLNLPPDLRPAPLSPECMAWIREHDTLRDYQVEAIVRGLIFRWGRIALATNAGKGAVMALLADWLWEQNVLILADEIAVFEALRGELKQWGGETMTRNLGFVESGVAEIPSGHVTLAMVPTLARRLKDDEDGTWKDWVGSHGTLLLDEADKASAGTWKRILIAAKASEYRLGFSGTFPEDGYEDLIMDELLGPVLVEKKNIELVERGISARPVVALHPFDAGLYIPDPPHAWRGWTGPERRRWVYEQGITHNIHRHSFVRKLIRPGIPTCVIINRVDHGHQLEEHIPDSRFLHGGVSKTDRNTVLEEFADGEFHVLIVTKIMDRGTNKLGHAVDLIFASAEGSKRQTLQRIGRGLRRTDGKPFLRLLDVIDRGHDYLHRSARKRVKLYENEGFDVRIET